MTSPTIQNERIEIIQGYIEQKIKKEIKEAKYVSIICDEGTDFEKEAQLVILFRYFYDGETRERIIDIKNISENKKANNISKIILDLVAEYGVEGKVISQCYDGAPVMKGNIRGVQSLVREKIPMHIFCIVIHIN